jgi:soluble lytic murein transglycosylase-like protein
MFKKIKKLRKFRKKRFRFRIKMGLWLWSILSILGLFSLPLILNSAIGFSRQIQQAQVIAPLFTPQVQYWRDDIARWSDMYGIDPNLMATIMQIESCGHPTVASGAGAQGLFQVMPFHFEAGESMLDPDTNAFRSANFIRECSIYANGDVGLTLACYNGGPSVTQRSFDLWAAETQRYYVWGFGIYIDAINYMNDSQTLDQWLLAGGVNLCNSAAVALGLD